MKEFVEYLIEEKKDWIDKFLVGAVYFGIGLAVLMLVLYTAIYPWTFVGILGIYIICHCLGRFVIFLISCLLNCRK